MDPENTYVWVTQIIDGDSVQITEVVSDSADATLRLFGRLREMFADKPTISEGDVWLELIRDGDLGEERVVCSASQAEWLLNDFLKIPKRHWKDLKV